MAFYDSIGIKKNVIQAGFVIIYSSLPWQLRWSKIHQQCRRSQFNSWVGDIRWRRDKLPTSVFLGIFYGLSGKESACNVGDLGLIPGLRRSPWRRERLPIPVFWPGEFMDCIVHGFTKSHAQLNNFHFSGKKEVATCLCNISSEKLCNNSQTT